MKKLRRPSGFFFLGTLAAIALISVVTLVLKLLEPELEIQLIALLYLLPVLLSTVLWGLWAGLVAGILSFLCFNYFFIQPYFTFSVHKSQDLITLIVFLIVVLVMSQLIGQAKTGVQLAKKREWEATKIYELIAELAGLSNENDITLSLRKRIMDTFDFRDVAIRTEGESPDVMSTSLLGDNHNQLVIPMETRTRMIGEIWVNDPEIKLSFEERRLLHAFAYQGALAIERVHLVERENEARIFEESDKIKTSLLNSISHELRSPLAAIKASVSSLRIGAVKWDSPARKELLATVEEETDQLNLLVGNLLDMSRIEAGALLPKKQWNSLSEIIASVIARLNSQLAQNEIKLEIPADIPLIATDYVMMEQVFINLISNSMKYAPEGSPILIKAMSEKENLHIQVINQGPAVPDEHLEHIFDKFFRITKADKITGTGLGLSICKGIVEAHGGKIWAENLSEGFCFHILLPLMLNGEYPSIPEG